MHIAVIKKIMIVIISIVLVNEMVDITHNDYVNNFVLYP